MRAKYYKENPKLRDEIDLEFDGQDSAKSSLILQDKQSPVKTSFQDVRLSRIKKAI